MNGFENVTLATLAGGAVTERFDCELQKVLENIKDLNTDAKATRKITLTVTIKPTEDRDTANVETQAKCTLAPWKSVGSQFFVGADEDGVMQAIEVKKNQLPGQMDIDEVNSDKVVKMEREAN